jgi:hypothetical protein
MSPRAQKIALALALLAICAFVISFIAGVRGGGKEDTWTAGALDRSRSPRVRIEVLNGAGQAGLAREATDRLRERGFDVVYFGNAREFGQDSSIVLDRVGREEAAQVVANALGITTVRSDPDSTLLLEVTVILGKDWPVGEKR